MIEQRRGTAPGLICPVGRKVVYAVPGVPHELEEMFERGDRCRTCAPGSRLRATTA